jgi:hypothetical protein
MKQVRTTPLGIRFLTVAPRSGTTTADDDDRLLGVRSLGIRPFGISTSSLWPGSGW